MVDHLKGRTTISEMATISNAYFHYFYKENFEKNVKREIEDRKKEQNGEKTDNISADDIADTFEELSNY